MATSQASTAAAVGRASRLDTRDHLATLAGKELALGIGTIGPRSRIADGLSAHAYRADALRRYNVLVLWVLDPPPSRSNPCRSTGEAGLDHPPRPNSGGHLPLAGEGFGFRCAGHCAARAPSLLHRREKERKEKKKGGGRVPRARGYIADTI